MRFLGRGQHHEATVLQVATILRAQLIHVAKIKRTVRAASHASRLGALLTQAIAAVALTGNTLFREILRLAIRAAHHTHATADALALILNHRAVGSLVNGARRAILQANRVLAVIAAKRVAKAQFAQYGMLSVPEDVLANYAKDILKNKQTLQNIIDRAVEEKLAGWLKEQVELDTKEVTADEFNKLFEE